jgi:hypothetical protein
MLGLLTSRLAVGSLPPPPPPQAASAASNTAPGTCLSEPLRFCLNVVLVFMGTSVFILSACGLLLVQAGQGDMGNLDGVWFARDFFHATCCTYLDDNGLDFSRAFREFRHWPDGTAFGNDVWKLALISGAFARTNGRSLTRGHMRA